MFAMWRRFSQLHEDERLVAFAATPRGRWLVWLVGSLLMFDSKWAWFVIPSVALVTYLPDRRRLVLSLGAVAAAVEYLVPRQERMGGDFPPAQWLAVALALLVFAGILVAAFRVARGFERLPGPLKRRPHVFAHLFLWSLLLANWLAPSDGGLGSAVLALTAGMLLFVVFRIDYLLLSAKRGHVAGTRLRDHAFYLFPGFGGSNTPYGKGFDYLSRREAPDAEAFARSQLAGLKLLCLSWLWRGAQWAMGVGFYGEEWGLGISLYGDSMVPPGTSGLAASWLGLYGALVSNVLQRAVTGHLIIGGIRLLGFNVFRNTYKPLLSETLIDFWGRYYYYFKELLVEFFFYPTYVRFAKLGARSRVTLAVFAAAFVGNMYYHLIASERYAFLAGEFVAVLEPLEPRLVYCVLLAAGISISMIRQRERRGRVSASTGAAGKLRRVRAIFGVWTFYAIIQVWNMHPWSASALDRLNYVLSLVGL